MFVPVLGIEPWILNLWDDLGLGLGQGARNWKRRLQDGPENYGRVGYDLNAPWDFIY